MRALLHFHFREEHGGSSRGNRNVAAFRAAHSVENVLLVAGSDDASQRSQWSANNVHAANQFVGTAVGVHFVDDHGKYLKSLRQGTRGQSEAALNVVKIETVRLILSFYFVD